MVEIVDCGGDDCHWPIVRDGFKLSPLGDNIDVNHDGLSLPGFTDSNVTVEVDGVIDTFLQNGFYQQGMNLCK